LLDYGADASLQYKDAYSDGNYSILEFACNMSVKNEPVVELLLQNGADACRVLNVKLNLDEKIKELLLEYCNEKNVITSGSEVISRCPVESEDHSDQIIPIVYGEPTDETLANVKKGEILHGGCVVDANSPRWHCKKHDVNF
jgi:hypothetical protein